jgi:hypothetical protein
MVTPVSAQGVELDAVADCTTGGVQSLQVMVKLEDWAALPRASVAEIAKIKLAPATFSDPCIK